MTKEGVQLVRHIAGGFIAQPVLYFKGLSGIKSDHELKQLQSETAGRLEEQLSEQKIQDTGAFKVLKALQDSDCSDKLGYESVKNIYVAYTKSEEQPAKKLRDSIFKR